MHKPSLKFAGILKYCFNYYLDLCHQSLHAKFSHAKTFSFPVSRDLNYGRSYAPVVVDPRFSVLPVLIATTEICVLRLSQLNE